MLLLLVEDDMKIAKLLLSLLSKDSYQVDHAKDGEEALLYSASNQYDLVILDWMLPIKSGLLVAKALRSNGYSGGILMLTAKDGINNKILGFEAGVDDYLVKPFAYEELKLRIIALLRRSRNGYESDLLIAGPLSIDRTQKQVTIKGALVPLSKREYQLLLVLAENVGQTLPRARLINLVWGLDSEITPNNLDAYIRLLRKKIESKAFKPIKNVRGIGYRLEVNDHV